MTAGKDFESQIADVRYALACGDHQIEHLSAVKRQAKTYRTSRATIEIRKSARELNVKSLVGKVANQGRLVGQCENTTNGQRLFQKSNPPHGSVEIVQILSTKSDR